MCVCVGGRGSEVCEKIMVNLPSIKVKTSRNTSKQAKQFTPCVKVAKMAVTRAQTKITQFFVVVVAETQ